EAITPPISSATFASPTSCTSSRGHSSTSGTLTERRPHVGWTGPAATRPVTRGAAPPSVPAGGTGRPQGLRSGTVTTSPRPAARETHEARSEAVLDLEGVGDALAANLTAIRERIAAACRRVGRDPSEVELLPVSKTRPPEVLRLAYAAGVRKFGENKVQEAKAKAEALSDLADLRWAVIGHLQTNKAKYVARFAHEFHALDSLRVAEALDRRLQAEGRGLDVYVQVNSSGEASKFGLPPEEVPGFVKQLPNYTALRVRGLMTLALFSDD